MEDKINLTEEQERMWKKLSTPYAPPVVGNYGAYSYASYAPPAVGYKTTANGMSSLAFGYATETKKQLGIVGIVIGA